MFKILDELDSGAIPSTRSHLWPYLWDGCLWRNLGYGDSGYAHVQWRAVPAIRHYGDPFYGWVKLSERTYWRGDPLYDHQALCGRDPYRMTTMPWPK